MSHIPEDRLFDSTLGLVFDGYEFISKKCQRYQSDIFQTRLLLEKTGGGDYYINHRCPGEWITIELMKVSLNFLTKSLQYEVPKQDLEISLSTMPTAPKSGFIISNVKLAVSA